jgi:hypothetical protein
MSSSFVVAAAKVLDGIEPRFVVLAGDEYELKRKLLNAFTSRGTELVSLYDPSSVATECFLAPYRPSKEKIIFVHCADEVESWDWLPIWFNKVKRTKLVVLANNADTVTTLETRANTRGLIIDCEAPSGAGGQMKLAKMISGWYGQSQTQVNLLLVKSGWKISPCLQLLNKLELLNLPLSSETVLQIGVVFDPVEDFIEALTDSNSSLAMSVLPKVSPELCRDILVRLSSWLDRMVRVKLSHAPMKSVHDVANEVGETRIEVERLQKQARKFTVERINRLALALAGTDRELAAGYRNGVLESMVSKWD